MWPEIARGFLWHALRHKNGALGKLFRSALAAERHADENHAFLITENCLPANRVFVVHWLRRGLGLLVVVTRGDCQVIFFRRFRTEHLLRITLLFKKGEQCFAISI